MSRKTLQQLAQVGVAVVVGEALSHSHHHHLEQLREVLLVVVVAVAMVTVAEEVAGKVVLWRREFE